MGQAPAARVAPVDSFAANAWMQELRRVAKEVYAPLTRDALAALREATVTYGRAQGVDARILRGLRVFISLFQLDKDVPWQYGVGMQELFMAPCHFYTHRFDRIVNALLRADTPQALARVLESTDTMALVDSVCLLFAMQSTRCPLAMTVYRSTDGVEHLPCVHHVFLGRWRDVPMSLSALALRREGFTRSATMWAHCVALTMAPDDDAGHSARPPFGFAFGATPPWARAFLLHSPLHAFTNLAALLNTTPTKPCFPSFVQRLSRDAAGHATRQLAVLRAVDRADRWFAATMAKEQGGVWQLHLPSHVQWLITQGATFRRRTALILAGLIQFLAAAVPKYIAAVVAIAADVGEHTGKSWRNDEVRARMTAVGAELLRSWVALVFRHVGMLLQPSEERRPTAHQGRCTIVDGVHSTQGVSGPLWHLEGNAGIATLFDARAQDVRRLHRTPLGSTSAVTSFMSTSLIDDVHKFGDQHMRLLVGLGVQALPIFVTGSQYDEENELLVGPATQALRVPSTAADSDTTVVLQLTPPPASAAQAVAAGHICTAVEFLPLATLKVALALAAMALPARYHDSPARKQARIKQVATVMLGEGADAALARVRRTCIAFLRRRAQAVFPLMRHVASRTEEGVAVPHAHKRRAPAVGRVGASVEAPGGLGVHTHRATTKRRRRHVQGGGGGGGGGSHLVDVWDPTSVPFCFLEAVFEAIGGWDLERQMLSVSEEEVAAVAREHHHVDDGRLAPPRVPLLARAQYIMLEISAHFARRMTRALPWYLTHVGEALLSAQSTLIDLDVTIQTRAPTVLWWRPPPPTTTTLSSSEDGTCALAPPPPPQPPTEWLQERLCVPDVGQEGGAAGACAVGGDDPSRLVRVTLPRGIQLRVVGGGGRRRQQLQVRVTTPPDLLHVVPHARPPLPDDRQQLPSRVEVTWKAAATVPPPPLRGAATTTTPGLSAEWQEAQDFIKRLAREVFVHRWTGGWWDTTKFSTAYLSKDSGL